MGVGEKAFSLRSDLGISLRINTKYTYKPVYICMCIFIHIFTYIYNRCKNLHMFVKLFRIHRNWIALVKSEEGTESCGIRCEGDFCCFS